jgi:hypothetical protein
MLVSFDVLDEYIIKHTFVLLQKGLERRSALVLLERRMENLHPISVCLAVGFSSAYLHILRRSSSDKVLRTEGPDLADEPADTGVIVGGEVVPT